MSTDADRPPRTIVLCFDGTGNLYDATNTNVVKLFSLLKRDNRDEQLVYYQAGVGTYSAPGIMAGVQLWFAKQWDEAVAWYLDAHVRGGYQFLMQNYLTGDRICLFGFSRGAYTARALAGMLYKVGLLPKDNKEQIGFAYKMYKSTGKKNRKLASGFKQTFCRTVQIEFMGCWDTVSSVGLLWGRHLPFTSSSTIIKRFRHALSLDEHRAKFQPNLWHRDAPDHTSARDDPEHGSHVPRHKESEPESGDALDQPGATTDVLEVWFAGCHSDVGGGETPSDAPHSLCNITLRWMLREIVASQCGIQFDNAALARADIPLSMMTLESDIVEKMARAAAKTIGTPNTTAKSEAAFNDNASSSEVKSNGSAKGETMAPEIQLQPVPDEAQEDAQDALEPLHDELKLTPIWWLLEIIPLFVSSQDEKGVWHREFKWNLGRGREICKVNPNVHTTVQQRMADKSLAYVPKATWGDKPNATWMN